MHRFFILVALLLLVLSSCQCGQNSLESNFVKEADSLTLLYTTSVQGYVDPCGCTANPLGGIARLAFLVDEARKNLADQVIFLDSGNLLFESSRKLNAADLCQNEARLDLLLSVYKSLDVVATVQGPFDRAMGRDFYNSYLQKHQVADLSASLSAGKIITRSGIKVGIIGFSTEAKKTLEQSRTAIKNQVSAFKAKDCQLVVILAQAPLKTTRQLLDNMSGVDVVISGQDTGEKPMTPEWLGKKGPLLVSAGMQGQYLGILEFRNISKNEKRFVLDDSAQKTARRVSFLENRVDMLKKEIMAKPAADNSFIINRIDQVGIELKTLRSDAKVKAKIAGANILVRNIALEKSILEKPEVKAKLVEYGNKLSAFASACESNVECEKPKPGQATFVGVQSCRECHQEAYEVWEKAVVNVKGKDDDGKTFTRKSGHSIAWSTLEKANKTMDRSCVGCHSVGFMKPGGYCKVSEITFQKNVQCETCHGPGSLHVENGDKKFIKLKVPESTCRECHHVPHIESYESFNYDESLKKILGRGHGFDLLKRLEK